MNEAARLRWDDTRREPSTGSGREASDPLAELARLVGQDDPYRAVFRPASAAAAPTADVRRWEADEAGTIDHGQAHGAGEAPAAEEWHDYGSAEPAHHGDHAAGAEAWAGHGEGFDEHHDQADDERYYAADAATHRDDAGIADSRAAVDGAEASIPDLWARDGGHGDVPQVEGTYDTDRTRTREGGSARRPLLVLGAVLLLTGGGLGASFLAKGGTAASVATTRSNDAPTILAASGPTKVKQDDPGATAPEDKDAALLSKGPRPIAGPVKVVQSEEQPADLGQLPKAGDGAAMAQPSSPFPEAKKVKTFVVHPDGTPIYDDGQAVAEALPPPSAAIPAPQTSTPKAASMGVTTPSSPTIASLVAGAPPATDTAPAPGAPKPTKPKPTEKATGAGVFGLQLAASPSEAEAHAAFAKLKKKYPTELGSLSANVHQSETGGKPVYRVRIGGMTREEAGGLCSKLMAGGGSCFVVHD